MTTISDARAYAKLRHPRCCQVTGLPVEPGDCYCVSVYTDGGAIHRFKALAIICDLVQEVWSGCDDWLDYQAPDALWDWLLERLPEDEATLCLEAALAYWRGNRL